MTATVHQPVMLAETLEGLRVRSGGLFLDCTLGGGGHSEAILEASGPEGRVLGLDRDTEALRRAGRRLERFGPRFQVVHSNFAGLREAALSKDFLKLDGVLMDLGVSSDQLETPERGFSFRLDGPLDMRMDPTCGQTAAEWLAEAGEGDIAEAVFRYGEDRMSRRIARAIVRARSQKPIQSTLELANLVEAAVGGRKGSKIHPATRTFQAVRMVVNDELPSVERGLEAALSALVPGGRLAVITFHSLEDRLVKQFFRAHEGREESLYEGGSEWRGEEPRVIRVTRKPVTATDEEASANPRARSAKLRVIEKRKED